MSNFSYQTTHYSTKDVLWALVELYTNMDIALLSDLMADVVLSTFQALEWSNPADHPGNLSRGQSLYFNRITGY